MLAPKREETMPSQNCCRGCGATRGLTGIVVHDLTRQDYDVDWEMELFCEHCLTRYGLVCEGHRLPMVCAYDTQRPEAGRDAIGMPTLFTCCRLCVDLAVRTMPRARATQMLSYVTKGDYALYLADFTGRMASSELAAMTDVDKVLYGLLMYVALKGFTVTEFTTGRARTA
jgi:hypothetical protein